MSLFPGDNTSKQVMMLKPSDSYSIKCLAWLRAVAAAYFTFHAALVIIASTEDFWKYLTNLTYICVMPSYILLAIAHLKNGDFTKAVYVEPTSDDLAKAPLTWFKWAIFMYELSMHLTLTVAMAFWLIEMPALALNGSVYSWKFMNWFELVFSHTLP